MSKNVVGMKIPGIFLDVRSEFLKIMAVFQIFDLGPFLWTAGIFCWEQRC